MVLFSLYVATGCWCLFFLSSFSKNLASEGASLRAGPSTTKSKYQRWTITLVAHSQTRFDYRPQIKLRKGNVFIPVCDSVHMGGVSQHALGWGVSAGLGVCPRGVCPGGVHPPQDQMQTSPPPSETKISTYHPDSHSKKDIYKTFIGEQ